MKNNVQLDSWQALKNGMVSTGKVMLKSLLKPTNLVIAGVTAMIVVLHKTNEAVEEVRERADELSNAFNNNKSDIEGYKDKIEGLYKTISDSGSSLEEVTTARQTLMTVQDELIDKFGDEKETIDLVTQAIYGQSSALDELIKKQWQETKNEFNESDMWNDFANWQEGYSDNIDRMVHEMENAWGNIKMSTSDYFGGEYDDIIKRLEEAGWEYSSAYETFIKGGSVEDLYEEILDIQTLVGDDMPENFLKSLTDDANELKATLDNYEGMWDNYILNDKIFVDDNLADSWKEVNDAYTKYQNAVASGDKTAIEEATSGFATSINEVLNDENVSDSVKDYFKDMYPALYREVEKWEFKTNIIPEFDTSGLQGKTQADVLEMLQTKGTQDGENTFNSIIDSAIKYGLILDDDTEGIQKILDLLVEWGILQGAITDNTAPQTPDEITVSNIFELEDADGTLTTLGKISESIDTIQNAYKTLNDAIDEYNETGSFSIDTLQSVIALGDNWLDYLVDEEGKLKLDKEALQQLTASRLEDMKMQAINNIIDNVSKIQTDADATLYLASTNYALAESYKDVAENAIEAAKAQMELAVVAGTLSQENYEASASKMDADIEKVYKLFDNTDFISDISLGGGSGSKSKSDFKETVDFFERRIDILNDTISRLKSNLEIVTGSFAKNNLIDAQSSIYQEELRNYTDALAMYQKKANEVLATLPDDIAEKVKNGAIDLTTFVGASSEAVVDAINEYEQWAEKVDDCNLQLIELQKTLSDLELEKFNNVVSDFSSQFDLRDNVVTNIDKHIALLEEQGQLIGASFYDTQIQQSQKQLNLLEQEKIQLVEQMNSALASGNVKTGSEAWLEMVGVLSDVEGQITDCKKSIEEFSNEILELNWKSFERVQDTFSDLNTELENFVGLLDDIDVADDKGNWSTEAKTKLGLLSQQYELAVYQVGEYKSAIEELKKQYTNGDYSAIEFSEKLAELSDGMWDATNSANDLRDAIVDLNEQRVEVQIEGIEKEISAYEELVDEQIKLIEETDNLIKKRDDLAEKSKSVTDLERQIASMMHDDSQATVAKRLKLEEELAKARKDLADTEREYSVDSQKTALEKQLEEYTNERNAEIEALEKSLENKEQLIADSFNVVKQNANLIGQQIAQIATEHGVIVSDSLISSWAQGENAIASYGTVLSSQSSAFIGNIMDVESKVWDLQSQANNTSISLAGMFSTQADNLVSELSQSYYAEGNVLNMTNALHDSLVNTLESGYDVSSITSALKSIEDSAKSAADEIRGLGDLDVSVDNTDTERYRLVDKMTGKPYKENLTYAEAVKLQEEDKQVARHTTIERYASGTRNSKGNIIITDEEGQELKLPKLSSGNYTIANEGTQILTKAQTDNIFEWSKLHPIDMIPWSVRNSMQNVANNFPQVATRNVNNTPSLHLDKLIHIDKVDSTNIKQMESIANKACDRLVNKLYDGKVYGSY